MSTNTDVIRGAYAAFARADIAGVLGILAPTVSWTEAAGFPYSGTYVGPEAILSGVFMRLATEWEGFAATPEHFVAQADTVVALGTYSGRYRATGKSFKAPFAHVWTLDGGKVVRFFQHTDTVLVRQAMQ